MPTVILLDVSLSMCRTVRVSDSNDVHSVRSLATIGISSFLDHLTQTCKLEFASLMLFSSLWEKHVSFTRDYESIKAALLSLDSYYDKTNIVNGLTGVQEMVQEDWGSQVPCQVLLITDGYAGINAVQKNFGLDEDPTAKWPLPFRFPCKLHIVCVGCANDPCLQTSIPFYEKMIEACNAGPQISSKSDTQLWIPDGGSTLSVKGVQQMFTRLAEANYQPYKGQLMCGNLVSPITLFPPLEPVTQINDFETLCAQPAQEIIIRGFMDIAEVASPPIHSRHLMFSLPMTRDKLVAQPSILTIAEGPDVEETINSICAEDGKQPSLCVLLHGSLKVEGMVAICQVGSPDWYGMLYSWADSKKKSNLMLSTFKCGANAVPWLGDLRMLGLSSISTKLSPAEISKYSGKKSYSQSVVVWVKPNWLQSDIQKILRLAKRLPDKTANFYKELTRFRKAAFSTGFYDILEGLAALLERECRFLPDGHHPEAAMQLTHAVHCLRNRAQDDYEADIVPLKTKFEQPR